LFRFTVSVSMTVISDALIIQEPIRSRNIVIELRLFRQWENYQKTTFQPVYHIQKQYQKLEKARILVYLRNF